MFLASSLFHLPVLASNEPMFHSVGMFLPSGVLLRALEPPHWPQSCGPMPCGGLSTCGGVVLAGRRPWPAALRCRGGRLRSWARRRQLRHANGHSATMPSRRQCEQCSWRIVSLRCDVFMANRSRSDCRSSSPRNASQRRVRERSDLLGRVLGDRDVVDDRFPRSLALPNSPGLPTRLGASSTASMVHCLGLGLAARPDLALEHGLAVVDGGLELHRVPGVGLPT